MSIASHLTALERKHEDLEREIASELAYPNSDSDRVLELKKRKLHLKDEIVRLRTDRAPETLH